MVNAKKLAAVTAATSGLVLAGAGVASASSGAIGNADHSPGVVSGNVIQIPLHVPVNLCGDSIDVIGLINPTFGNVCENEG